MSRMSDQIEPPGPPECNCPGEVCPRCCDCEYFIDCQLEADNAEMDE